MPLSLLWQIFFSSSSSSPSVVVVLVAAVVRILVEKEIQMDRSMAVTMNGGSDNNRLLWQGQFTTTRPCRRDIVRPKNLRGRYCRNRYVQCGVMKKESDDPMEYTSSYLGWAASAGVVSPKVTQDMIGNVRGMVALDRIDAGEVFVSLPRVAALVVDPLEKCPCPDFVEMGYYKKAPWYVKMAILLLSERAKGRESRVYGYIEQLPLSIDTPVRWNEEELRELQNGNLQKGVVRQREEWKKIYKELAAATKGLKGEVFVTKEKVFWALENVRSRSFSGPYAGSPLKERLTMAALLAGGGLGYALVTKIPLESIANAAVAAAAFNLVYDIILSSKLKWYAMCPIIDSLNHSGKVDSSIEYEYFKDKFVVSTSSPYEPGEEVFITYGAKTNDQLLQYYGFVEKNNPHDLYSLVIDVAGTQVPVSIKPNGQLSKESIDAMNTEDLKNNVEGKISEVIKGALRLSISRELDEKATSLKDDLKLMESPGMIRSDRQALALRFRISQKEILQKALAVCRKN